MFTCIPCQCLNWITHGRARFVVQTIVTILVLLIAGAMILVPAILELDIAEQMLTPGVVIIIFIVGRWFTAGESNERDRRRQNLRENVAVLRGLIRKKGDNFLLRNDDDSDDDLDNNELDDDELDELEAGRRKRE